MMSMQAFHPQIHPKRDDTARCSLDKNSSITSQGTAADPHSSSALIRAHYHTQDGPKMPTFATTVYEHSAQANEGSDEDTQDYVINDTAAAEREDDCAQAVELLPMPEMGSVSTGISAPHLRGSWGISNGAGGPTVISEESMPGAAGEATMVSLSSHVLAALLRRVDALETNLEQIAESASAQVCSGQSVPPRAILLGCTAALMSTECAAVQLHISLFQRLSQHCTHMHCNFQLQSDSLGRAGESKAFINTVIISVHC
jgi:hypothetical protein